MLVSIINLKNVGNIDLSPLDVFFNNVMPILVHKKNILCDKLSPRRVGSGANPLENNTLSTKSSNKLKHASSTGLLCSLLIASILFEL